MLVFGRGWALRVLGCVFVGRGGGGGVGPVFGE